MTDKLYSRIAIGWALLLLVLNLFEVPYLDHTTSGGEQASFTFIVTSIEMLIIGQILLLIIYLITRPKKHNW